MFVLSTFFKVMLLLAVSFSLVPFSDSIPATLKLFFVNVVLPANSRGNERSLRKSKDADFQVLQAVLHRQVCSENVLPAALRLHIRKRTIST